MEIKKKVFYNTSFFVYFFGTPKKFNVWTLKEYLREIDLEEVKNFYDKLKKYIK